MLSFEELYLEMSFLIARKSKDPNTKCGCVLTDRNNIPLGIGYNGPVRDIDDAEIPWEDRDARRDYMTHAEMNAIFNTNFPLRYVPGGAVAYVNAICCNKCLQDMYQAGVTKVLMCNRLPRMCESDKFRKQHDHLKRILPMEIITVEVRTEWLKHIE